MNDGNSQRHRPIEAGILVQHIDGRQGRVLELKLFSNGLEGAVVRWLRGGETEHLALGYIWATSMEENE